MGRERLIIHSAGTWSPSLRLSRLGIIHVIILAYLCWLQWSVHFKITHSVRKIWSEIEVILKWIDIFVLKTQRVVSLMGGLKIEGIVKWRGLKLQVSLNLIFIKILHFFVRKKKTKNLLAPNQWWELLSRFWLFTSGQLCWLLKFQCNTLRTTYLIFKRLLHLSIMLLPASMTLL